jgi:hypothetical protein
MSGADFFYGTTYRAFGGGWSGEPSVSRVDDDIDVGKNLKSPCGDKPPVKLSAIHSKRS